MRKGLSLILVLIASATCRAGVNFGPSQLLLAAPAASNCWIGSAHAIDLDADGLSDFACTPWLTLPPYTGAMLKLYLNRGANGFVAAPEVDASNYAALKMEDLDGDGRPDVAAVHVDAGTSNLSFAFRRGLGDGSFDAETRVPAMAGVFPKLLFADLDADGDLDPMIVADTSIGTLRNDGGSFVFLATQAMTSLTLVVAFDRIDSDAYADLLVRPDGGVSSVMLRGRGDGTFDPPQTISAIGPYALMARSLDFNADGRSDLLVGEFLPAPTSALSYRTLRREADGNLTETGSMDVSQRQYSARDDGRLADLDGDGAQELVRVASQVFCPPAFGCVPIIPSPNGIDAISIGADGTLSHGPAFNTGGLADVGDVDGDGRLDAISVAANGALAWRRGTTLANAAPAAAAVVRLKADRFGNAGTASLSASDADGNFLSYRVVSGPRHANAEVQAYGGWVNYTVPTPASGMDVFEVEAFDGAGGVTRTRVEVDLSDVFFASRTGGSGAPDLWLLAALALLASAAVMRRRGLRLA